MRGLLIVNPRATTTSQRVTDILIDAFGREVELDVVETEYRRHGFELGRASCGEVDVVITLGGDGIIHEVVNGMLFDGPGPQVPVLAPVPGGSGNVFARALGIPAPPVEATGHLVQALRARRFRSIGLGQVRELSPQGDPIGQVRWFTANAGLGLDAEVIAAMEQQRAAGAIATPGRYLQTTLQTWLRGVDRDHPRLHLTGPDGRALDDVFLAIVQNTSPWTYFGSIPINPSPDADVDRGLYVFALRSLSALTTARAVTQMLTARTESRTRLLPGLAWGLTGGRPTPASAKDHANANANAIVRWADFTGLTVRADSPVAVQIDGEFVGQGFGATFHAVAHALRVAC